MIKTVSEFLEALKSAENESLKKQNITHRPTIGDMYEGLTKSLLDLALPTPAPWSVTSGFIVDAQGKLSDELDCLIVTGEGDEVPYTQKRKFVIDDVVAVIQVKKNLYSTDLRDGYQNLLSATKFDATRSIRAQLLQDAFQGITRTHLPAREDLGSLPFELQMIYHSLVTCLTTPVRIILGYNGFKSHERFRQSFIDYLTEQTGKDPKQGFGPTSFPDLIICGDYSLVKCNGMPFCGSLDKNLNWPFFCSSGTNPLNLLLELVWTRLVYLHGMSSDVFDEDIWLTPLNGFLLGKAVTTDDGRQGWDYQIVDMSDADLSKTPEPPLWEPVFVDRTQFVIMNELCDKGTVSLDDDLSGYLKKNGYELEDFIRSLSFAGLAARAGDKLVLLTRGCVCVILPDGRFATGENNAGQMERWMQLYIDERKSKTAEKEAGDSSSRSFPSSSTES